eukprot:COSAG03_NODE_4138_length_1669_cov_11.577070_2_plen_261_part_00
MVAAARGAGILLLLLLLLLLSASRTVPQSATSAGPRRHEVAFGPPQLVGSSNFTHFWFPASVLTAGHSDGLSTGGGVLQGIQQAGDGAVCPPPQHPDWPCSALRASSDGRGSAWQPETVKGAAPSDWPPTTPFPLLPQSALNSRRAQDASNFSSIHALRCANASCTGDIIQWQWNSAAAQLTPASVQPLTVHDVPANLRLAVDPGNPLMLKDGSVLVAVYVRLRTPTIISGTAVAVRLLACTPQRSTTSGPATLYPSQYV